jgi:hypothetical protein
MLHLPIERFGVRFFRPAPPPGGFTPNPGAGGGSGAGAAGGGAAAGSGGSAAAAGGGSNNPSAVYNSAAWLLQPSSFLDLDKYGSVQLPAMGAKATILTFTIPNGRYAKISGIGIDFQANGNTAAGTVFLQNVQPFQLTFNLTNGAIGTGWSDFASFNYLPGAVSAPMGIAGLMAKEGQTITLSVTNNTMTVGGTPQWIGAHLQGYFYPKSLEPPHMGNQ